VEGDSWELKGKFGAPAYVAPKVEEKKEEKKEAKKITKEDKAALMAQETDAHWREPKAGMVAMISVKGSPAKRLAVQGGSLVVADGDEYNLDNYWYLEPISPDNKFAGDLGVAGKGWHISSVASYNAGEKVHKGRLAVNNENGELQYHEGVNEDNWRDIWDIDGSREKGFTIWNKWKAWSRYCPVYSKDGKVGCLGAEERPVPTAEQMTWAFSTVPLPSLGDRILHPSLPPMVKEQAGKKQEARAGLTTIIYNTRFYGSAIGVR
jgi:hypothetical protein